DLHDQAAARRVARNDMTAVQRDDSPRDRKAKPRAAAVAIAGGRDAVERLEDVVELRGRYAGPSILDQDRRSAVLEAQLHHHGRSGVRESDGIAQYILDRASQQALLAVDDDSGARHPIHPLV